MTKIYIIAGEQSGDNFGAKLIKALKDNSANLEFYGVGGSKMEALGLKSLFPMSEISLFGFFEIIPHIFKLIKLIDKTVVDIRKVKPDIVITIDSPGFNCRIAKKLKEDNIKLVHYVAPTVWAYKESRAEKFAGLFDHLIAILPFEPPYFEKYKLPCTYVGHPVVEDEIASGEVFRKKHSIPKGEKILCLNIGSRAGEINRLLPIFAQATKMIRDKFGHYILVVPTFKKFKEQIETTLTGCAVKVIVVVDEKEKKEAMATSNVALTKSGTITTELALNSVPMVVAYKVNPLSALVLRMMIKVKYFTLINLITNKPVIPEFMQEECTAPNLADAVNELFVNEEACKKQVEQSKEALKALGKGETPTPSEKAAGVVMQMVNNL